MQPVFCTSSQRPTHRRIRLVRRMAIQEMEEGKIDNVLSRDKQVRIALRLGDWELGETMTSQLTTRLRTLTGSAAQMGWITVTPEQALLAFDTAAALLGVRIPLATDEPSW